MTWGLLDRRPVAWCIQIAGVPYRFCSTVGPGADVLDGRLYDYTGALAQSPIDLLDAVLDVGPIDGQLDDVAPVASQSPVEIRLVARDARRADTGAHVHPLESLLRVAGHSSATRSVRLLVPVDHAPAGSGPEDIQVDRDVSSWTTPGPIHIGQEVLWAISTSSVGGYWFVGCTRGADLWSTQAHDVDAVYGEQPWVTSEVTTWRGRAASIWVSALGSDGQPLGWVQYWRGLVDSAPAYDGRTITLRLSALTAAMSYRLGVGAMARTTTSVLGCHRLDRGTADVLDWQVSADRRIVLRATAANAVTGAVTLDAQSQAYMAGVTGVRQTVVAYDAGSRTQVQPVGYTAPDLLLPVGSQVLADIVANVATTDELRLIGEVSYRSPLRLFDPSADHEIVAWPDRLLDTINQAQAWQEVVACWADPSAGGLQPRPYEAQLARSVEAWDLWAYALDDSDLQRAWITWVRGGRSCRAGWLIGETADQVRQDRDPRTRLIRDPNAFTVRGVRNAAPAQNHYAHDGPAWWWYQNGEPYIGPFAADVYSGSGTPQLLELTGSGDPKRIWIIGSSSAVNPATGELVYWYEVRDPESAPNILLLEDDPPLSAQVVAAAYGADPMEYLRSLLLSGVGNGDNGLPDTLPIGANLPGVAVDATSFQSLAAPAPLLGQRYEAVRGKSITDQTAGLVLSCGAQVAQVYHHTGTWRIGLITMAAADATQVALDISDADMVVSAGREPVQTIYDGRTVRAYVVRLNYRANVQSDQPEEIQINTSTERNDSGADSGQPLMLDLPGVQIASAGGRAAAAAELVSDIRSRVGAPRLRWVLTIRADLDGAMTISLGSTVRLTSEYALGIDPTTTASNTLCRVVGMRRDLQEGTLRLELRPYSGIAGGWAQSATVLSAPTLTQVVIQPDDYSAADIELFSIGDVVTVFTPGAWSARTQLTITSMIKASNIIGFGAPHGAAPGDIIHAASYSASAVAQRGQAYLADDGVLGAADDGQIIA